MVRIRRSTQPGYICVTFELPDSLWANRVYLTGDMLDAPRAQTPMRQDRDGVWRLTLDLPAGAQYKYRYQIDQSWRTEWNGDRARANPDPDYSVLDLINQ